MTRRHLISLCEVEGCRSRSVIGPREHRLGFPYLCARHWNQAAGYDPPEGSEWDESDNGAAEAAAQVNEG